MEEEINLVDIIRIIKRQKKAILIVFFIGVVITIVANFFFVKRLHYTVYEKTGIIELGRTDAENPIRPADQVVDEVNKNIYGSHPSLKASFISRGLFSFKISSENKEEVEKYFTQVSEKILESQNNKIQARKQEMDDKEKKIESFIARFNSKDQALLSQIGLIDLHERMNLIKFSQLEGESSHETTVNNFKRIGVISLSGFILSIFLSLFAAFIKEWLDKNLSRIRRSVIT